MDRETAEAGKFRPADYLKITIYSFAIAAVANSLHIIILPIRVLDFVAESQKATYLGLLTFAGLVVAMLIQPMAGAISDRFGFKWGRRRPYILIGAVTAALFLTGIGWGTSFAIIFVFWCLLQASSNTAQGAFQALIPDLAPERKRGLASGVKLFLEILGGVALLYPMGILMDRYAGDSSDRWLWLALGMLMIVLLGAMLATIITVKEPPATRDRQVSLLETLSRTFRIDVRANRNFIWFLVSRLLILMAFTTLQTFALYFLKDVVGVERPAVATAQFAIVVMLCMLAAAYPAGRFSDRVGRRPIMIAAGLLGALGMLLILFFQHDYMMIMACGGLVGLAFGAFTSTNWAMATDLVAKGEEARYMGLTNLATAGGAALARLIGPAIDYFNNYSAGMGYSVMLVACFIYFLTGSLLIFRIRVTN